MSEKKKLEEAKYFYLRMIDEQENKQAFIYNLTRSFLDRVLFCRCIKICIFQIRWTKMVRQSYGF